MINKILFPAEFAPYDRITYRYVYELAKYFEAEVVVMHSYAAVAALGRGDDNERMAEVFEKLNEFVDENTPAEFKSLSIDRFAENDYGADGILKVAKRENVDLIITSMESEVNPGITNMSDHVLTLIRRSDIPVLAVPPSATYHSFKKMVFSTNFEFDDLLTINFLKEWAEAIDSEVHILHILKDKNSVKEAARMDALIKAYSGQKGLTFDFVSGEKVIDSIETFTEAINADLAVFTTHKRGLLGRLLEPSVTQKMAKKLHVPILVIKS